MTAQKSPILPSLEIGVLCGHSCEGIVIGSYIPGGKWPGSEIDLLAEFPPDAIPGFPIFPRVQEDPSELFPVFLVPQGD